MDINEIARLAGVSRATVSRYLNNGYVSQEKRKLISRVIQETGYVPSQSAQQLRTGKTNLVGIIIPKMNSQSVSRMVSGMTEGFVGTDYHTLLSNTNNDPDEEVRCLRVLADRPRVDGVILLASVITDEHIAALRALKFPVVILGQHVDGFSCVYHDDYRATFDVAKVALRHAKHPAFIGVRDDDVSAGAMRHRGFLDACHAAGIEVADQVQMQGEFTIESGYLCCEQIMDIAPETDAVICATDNIAYGAITCLREYGHRVPDDVQVTGIGDSELSRVIVPSVTSAHLFFKTSGLEASKMLIAAMDNGDEIPRQLKMGYEIYGRNSTR
ncbi:MAG: LacI family DNA-binding transcriptional regulator [Atopobiaceae bacterium]|nr:LacI family DNA-binding transcriptional regulator [Atopobiaceae bacterium]